MGITDFVFVINDWRRKGIASYMLCKGLEYFKENGLEYAELEVNASNRNALSLYEKLGYSVVDQSDFYILDLS